MTAKYCIAPFAMYEMHVDGGDSVCCPSHNNHPELQGNTILEKFNSSQAKVIRESVLDGSYRYCKDSCPFLYSHRQGAENLLFRDVEPYKDNTAPLHVVSAEDRTCNLACPTCRKDFILDDESGRDIERELSEISESVTTFVTSGSGDPLYNKRTFKLLQSLTPENYPALKKVELYTNGMLLSKENLEKLSNLKNYTFQITLSVDAACKETYEEIRRGGSWQVLMRNIENLNNETGIDNIKLAYVVQRKNCNEILDFFNLMEEKLSNHKTSYWFFDVENWWMDDKQFAQYTIPETYDVEHTRAVLSEHILSGKVIINTHK